VEITHFRGGSRGGNAFLTKLVKASLIRIVEKLMKVKYLFPIFVLELLICVSCLQYTAFIII
jgi:hypothetical protein